MNIWIEIDSKTVFKAGDIIAEKNEIVSSCDGDRASFASYKDLILRPVKDKTVQKIQKQIAKNFFD